MTALVAQKSRLTKISPLDAVVDAFDGDVCGRPETVEGERNASFSTVYLQRFINPTFPGERVRCSRRNAITQPNFRDKEGAADVPPNNDRLTLAGHIDSLTVQSTTVVARRRLRS